MPTVIKPEELLEKIKNREDLADDYVVTLYGPIPKEGRTSADDARELELHSQQRKALEQLLKNKACPKNLTVEVILTNEYSGWNGEARRRTPVEPIFDMVGRGACPQGLTLVLTQKEGDAYLRHFERDALERALTSNASPEDLTLRFSDPIDTGRVYFDASKSTGLRQYAEAHSLIEILQSGKAPWGFKLEYQKPNKLREDDKKEFAKLDKLLETYESKNIHQCMYNVYEKIDDELSLEIRSLLRRKGITCDKEQLKPEDKKRYEVLEALQLEISGIAKDAIDNISDIDLAEREAWKVSYKEKLQGVIKKSLSEPALEKYDDCQKFGIKLLNLVSFLLSPLKRLATGTFFYSTEGKSKEAVQETLDISEAMLTKKYNK
jgi:hypothetical protein